MIFTTLLLICLAQLVQPMPTTSTKSQITTATTGCPPGWVSKSPNGKQICYKNDKTIETFDAARKKCESFGGTLAMPKTQAEQGAIYSIRTHQANTWIGLSDQANENTFLWDDGTSLGTWTNWMDQQPNNYNADGKQEDEDCVHLNDERGWNDINCLYKMNYVCQKKAYTN